MESKIKYKDDHRNREYIISFTSTSDIYGIVVPSLRGNTKIICVAVQYLDDPKPYSRIFHFVMNKEIIWDNSRWGDPIEISEECKQFCERIVKNLVFI